MAYTKYSLTPANNTAAPPDGAPEGMLPSAVNDTMRDMMAQIRDCGDGIRDGTYTMTAPKITGGTITGAAFTGNTFTSPVISGGTINNATIGATTATTGKFTAVTNSALTSGRVTYAGTAGVLQDDADFTFNGTTVTMANDASISGLTVGRGLGSATSNTAVGLAALATNTSGIANSGFGVQALQLNTTGSGNAAFGGGDLVNYNATLKQNTTGSNNSAFGIGAMGSNTTGGNNTGLGFQALQANTTASNNTAVGYQAGYSNTTGAALTALGQAALYSNTTATNNIAIGREAGYSTTTGNANVFIGGGLVGVATPAGYANTTGQRNTYVGALAGNSMSTGSFNTIIGSFNGNQGSLDIRTASNYIVLSDGDGNPRIITENNGNTLIGTTVYNDAFKGILLSQNGRLYAIADASPSGNLNRLTSDGSILEFKRSGTIVGDVTVTTVATIYNTTSDYRLKTVIGSVKDSGQRIDALEPIEYDFKTGGRTKGFLAHKFAEVYPNSVSGEKDAVDAEGNPVYQSMQASTSEVMADLIAEIQSLRKRVALLESK